MLYSRRNGETLQAQIEGGGVGRGGGGGGNITDGLLLKLSYTTVMWSSSTALITWCRTFITNIAFA